MATVVRFYASYDSKDDAQEARDRAAETLVNLGLAPGAAVGVRPLVGGGYAVELFQETEDQG